MDNKKGQPILQCINKQTNKYNNNYNKYFCWTCSFGYTHQHTDLIHLYKVVCKQRYFYIFIVTFVYEKESIKFIYVIALQWTIAITFTFFSLVLFQF